MKSSLGRIPDDLAARILQQCGEAAVPIVETVSEKDWQKCVTDFASKHGWHWHHQKVSKMSKEGWPDLVLARPGELLFVELKTESGRLTAAQENWRDWLLEAGAEWYCFRPSDWPEVQEVLT